MFFNDDNKNTNIDEEFNENDFSVISTLFKYKFIFIGAIIFIFLILIMVYINSNKAVNYLVLNGDDVVTIYKESNYIETGYEAYNSKGINLNNNVNIKSKLNSSKLGEYEILYSLGNLVKVRTIKVIQKPDNYTYINLNKKNDTTDITIKVGESYIEPGYYAYGTGKNLTENVRVIGEVDTTKKGKYTLLYTVVDSNGITVSALRTVNVE